MYYCIKQLEERVLPSEIELLSWSERMDLVAFSNIKGEVALHRLNWTRAWCLAPQKEGEQVKALAWKPDGKIIAIATSSGQILLVGIENKNIIHKLEVHGSITCMEWATERIEGKNTKITSEQDDQANSSKNIDNSSTFLPDPPSLSNLSSFTSSDYEAVYTALHKQSELNMLAVGTKEGCIYISIFGCSPFIIYDLREQLGRPCSVINVRLSEELNLLYATVIDDANAVKIAIVETDIFRTHSKELFAVCMKHEYLNSIVCYLDNTINVIKETWESILLEMDAKLSKYASKVPPGTLSTDFLDLLVFGAVSELMQQFLLFELTKKGLEKFGQTIEMSYASIQKLLLRNVTKVGQNITYHLSELRGMARFKHHYEVLGLEEEKITQAILMTGAFLTKSGEMQLVINASVANYKAFFQWLYTVIMHITDEPIPSEIPKMTQNDLAQISEFVLNFDNINSDGSKTGFVMERLGQYLVDAPLKIPSGIEGNEWNKFLEENECIKNLPNVINHRKDTSLIQQFKILEKSISDCFENLKHSVVKQFNIRKVISVMQLNQTNFSNHKDFKVTNISGSTSSNRLSYAFLSESPPSQGFYFLELTVEGEIFAKSGYIFVPQLILHDQETLGDNYEILAIQFYTPNLLSLLLQENSASRTGVICQVSATAIREKILEVSVDREICTQDLININTCTLGNSVLRNTEGMVASNFAVSGSRKVSIVLSDNRRKVRIYEMEADEDEEEEAEMTTSTVRESDISMQEEENSYGE